MEIARLILVHFAVAATMSLGFIIGPMLQRAFLATADRLFAERRRTCGRWLNEVRTLEANCKPRRHQDRSAISL